MTAADTPTCWLCHNLGALVKVVSPLGTAAWLPFSATGPIRLDRGEHVCPACKGSHQPRTVHFAHQQGQP